MEMNKNVEITVCHPMVYHMFEDCLAYRYQESENLIVVMDKPQSKEFEFYIEISNTILHLSKIEYNILNIKQLMNLYMNCQKSKKISDLLDVYWSYRVRIIRYSSIISPRPSRVIRLFLPILSSWPSSPISWWILVRIAWRMLLVSILLKYSISTRLVMSIVLLCNHWSGVLKANTVDSTVLPPVQAIQWRVDYCEYVFEMSPDPLCRSFEWWFASYIDWGQCNDVLYVPRHPVHCSLFDCRCHWIDASLRDCVPSIRSCCLAHPLGNQPRDGSPEWVLYYLFRGQISLHSTRSESCFNGMHDDEDVID